MSFLQEANAAYIDEGPKIDHMALPIDQRPDPEILLDRFFIPAHGEQSWDHLTSCWIPFIQTGPRERKLWSKRRVAKAIDALVVAGLIADIDGSYCKWRLTAEARNNFDRNGRISA